MIEAESFLWGHPIVFENGAWLYVDTKEPTAGSKRECSHCMRDRDENGHDGCLGVLPGVMNACCGHGREDEVYVMFDANSIVRGADALKLIEDMKS